MLQIREISKQYKTEDLVQQALDHVSLNLRDHEFVAVLGPSGSGKSTFLNMIGGLDHYDSGDIIINGVSTREYTDRDWDAYRNHTIGFVFQSYNLIPHQTILANVELALTISGVSKKRRREMALDALDKVGLAEQVSKKPAQLSGGQMQRVALARALVNNPQILLADEPTGALDSDTSVQVMELLKEVSRHRLVVMVTHNADLAEEYATRIIRIRDGRLEGDTDPFEIPKDSVSSDLPAGGQSLAQANRQKPSMSFGTALVLSFNNLKSKLGRTILVSIAGSIGIIGIALILALSNGISGYIHNMEEGTILQYPLTLNKSNINISAYIPDVNSMTGKKTTQKNKAQVTENPIIQKYASGLTTNDLGSFRTYIRKHPRVLSPYVRNIEYGYDVTPQIFRADSGSIRQVHPDQCLTTLGIDQIEMSAVNLVGFFELPQNQKIYRNKYEVKAGHWPRNYKESVVVLNADGTLAETAIYALGLKNPATLDHIVNDLVAGKNVRSKEKIHTYHYSDLMGKKYKVFSRSDFYQYDRKQKIWVDQSKKNAFRKKLMPKGIDLKVVGVVQLKNDSSDAVLDNGICYEPSLVEHLMKRAAKSQVVQDQKKHPKTNVLTGEPFGSRKSADSLHLEDLFSIDQDMFKSAFKISPSGLKASENLFSDLDFGKVNLADLVDTKALLSAMPSSEQTLKKILGGMTIQVSQKKAETLFSQLADGYMAYAKKHTIINPDAMQEAMTSYLQSDEAGQIIRDFIVDLLGNDPQKFVDNPQSMQISSAKLQKLATDLASGFMKSDGKAVIPSEKLLAASFTDYLKTPSVQKTIRRFAQDSISTKSLQKQFASMEKDAMKEFGKAVEKQMPSIIKKASGQMQEQVQSSLMKKIRSGDLDLMNMFTVNKSRLAHSIHLNITEEELKDKITELVTGTQNTYATNMKNLGYAQKQNPDSITIYPKDFESKQKAEQVIADYNDRMKSTNQEDKVINYTDFAGTLMSTVSNIVDTVSKALIALVAVSLVVSSIMIGVITHISVLERKKEIGILRAIGASKHNIAEVFNAETFITGLLAGLIGVGVTELLTFPVNWAIHNYFHQPDIFVSLPLWAAGALVLLSIGLNVLSGLRPARKASKSDPVTALRGE